MFRLVKKRKAVVALGAVILTLGAGGTAFAVMTAGGGGTITKVNTKASTNPVTTSSTAFVDLPGAATTMYVPTDESALLTARFTAESQCTGGAAGNWCSIRIVDNATEMSPASGADYAFDTVTSSDDFYEGHALERDLVVSPGRHIVKVQRAVTSSATKFQLDDWHLTVERSQRTAAG